MSIKSRKHASPTLRPASGLTAATLITGLALAAPAAAQIASDSAAPDPTTLPEIRVEGVHVGDIRSDKVASAKFTQSLKDTPQTIQIITDDLFNQQGATTLTEVLRNSPGVGTFFVGENGNSTTGDTVFMRGFDSSASIFVDGVRDLGSISRDVFNTDQVEVEKGPAGTDNGRSAPTGAINLVSKQAALRDSASATVSVGTDHQRRLTADWNQSLGASSAVRMNVMAQDSDVIGREMVNNTRWGIAPSLGFGLGTDTRYILNLLYVKQDNIPDGSVPTLGLPGWTPQAGLENLTGHPVDPDNFYGTRHDYDKVTAQMATFRIEHDFSDTLKLSNIARWGKNDQEYMLTAFMSTGMTNGQPGNIQYTDPNDLSTYTMARSNPTFKDQEYTIVTDQLNLRADFKTGAIVHNLTTGVEIAREELKSWGVAARAGTRWPSANLYNPDPNVDGLAWGRNGARSTGKSTTASLYAFDTVNFSEQFLLTAGVRFDRYETDFKSTVACGGRGAPACGSLPTGAIVPGVDTEDSDTLVNWKLGAVYKIGETASLYAHYAISQQPPGGSSLELSNSTTSANNPAYDPQKARTAEIGSKWDLLGDDLLVALGLYQTEVENEVITEAGVTSQGGDKRVRGIELSAVGRITENWSLSAGYTTMDAKVINSPKVAQDGTTQLTYTPDSAFTAWTTYQLPFGLTIGGGVRYNGEMKRGTDGAIGTPTFVKSYTVWDAVVSYTISRNMDLRLNAYNLFDKQYVAAINKSGYRYTPGAPRSVLLSLNLRF